MASETMPEKPAHLDPSELGTKEYWENLYTLEVANHASNPADEGTVWFDDADAQSRMVEFLAQQLDAEEEGLESEPHLCAGFDAIDKRSARVVDLGCGNGSLLLALREEGWRGRLLGVDYADTSVALARRVQEARKQALKGEQMGEEQEEEEEWKDVEFQTWDVLNGDYADLLPPTEPETETEIKGEGEGSAKGKGKGKGKGFFDIVLDKGTFDAISLSAETDTSLGRRICEGYAPRVLDLLRDDGGLFLITSCNWTEQELKAWMESAAVQGSVDAGKKYRMRQIGRVKYPSFSFGGVQGSSVSTLCFVKEEVVEASSSSPGSVNLGGM